MPNTITDLIPFAYAALDIVARETIGMIPSVRRDASADRVAENQQLVIPITQARAAEDIAPGINPGMVPTQTIDNVKVEINKFRAVPFTWTGEEIASLNQGPGHMAIEDHEITQAFRTLTNEIETDLVGLSRDAGSSLDLGHEVFATKDDLSDAALARKELMDNGCPMSSLRFVMNTTTGANLRGKQPTLFRMNESGGDEDFLRRGLLTRDLFGFAFGESDKIVAHTPGTAAAHAVDLAAGYPVGATTIHVDSGTTPIINKGDIIRFASQTQEYVVAEDFNAAEGDIKIAKPGLRLPIADDNAITYVGAYTPSIAFRSSAMVLACRLPIVPPDGDAAIMSEIIEDPYTGLSFELRAYPQYRQLRYEVAIAWGVKTVKPEFICLLHS